MLGSYLFFSEFLTLLGRTSCQLMTHASKKKDGLWNDQIKPWTLLIEFAVLIFICSWFYKNLIELLIS